MAIFEVNGQEFEIEDAVQGDQLDAALNDISQQFPVRQRKLTMVGPRADQEQRRQQEQQAEPEQASFLRDLITGENRETETTKDLPELTNVGLSSLAGEGNQLKAAALAPLLLATPNDREFASILTRNIPEIGFAETPEGVITLVNNKNGTTAVLNQPGVSKMDVLQGLGLAALFTPTSLAATTASAVANGVRVGGAALGLQTLVEGIQKSTGGEEDKLDILLAGLGGFVGETFLPAIQSIRNAFRGRTSKGIEKEIAESLEVAPGAVDPALANIAKTEVTPDAPDLVGPQQPLSEKFSLTGPQQTADPAQLQIQSFVANLPEGSKQAVRKFAQQNEIAGEELTRLMDSIAPADVLEAGGEFVQNQAELVIKAQKEIRQNVAGPIYQDAFEEFAEDLGRTTGATGAAIPQPNLSALDSFIDKKKTQVLAQHPVNKVLNSFRSLLDDPAGMTLEQFQSAKEIVDADLARLVGLAKPTSADNKAKRALAQAETILLDELDSISPTFKRARARFAAESPAVDRLRTGVIGKIANANAPDVSAFARKLFNPEKANPTTIKAAEQSFKKMGPEGEQAWSTLVRSELQRRFAQLGPQIADSKVESPLPTNDAAQILRIMFGKKGQRSNILSAMTPNQRANALFFEEGLKRQSLGRVVGSPTGFRTEISQTFDKGLVPTIRRFIKSPVVGTLESVGEFGEQESRKARIKAVSDSFFDDDWAPDMARIRKITNQQKQAEAYQELLDDVINENVKAGITGVTEAAAVTAIEEEDEKPRLNSAGVLVDSDGVPLRPLPEEN